ncbi:hypothetical protein TNCV_4079791 [Trichonephila clavipes]|nr:hypothetical protein TNCV_4079791 [Trichonephila clavipes]
MQVTVRFCQFYLNLDGRNLGGGQGPPTNRTKRLVARRLFKVPQCRKGTFTNTHVFYGIRTQFVGHRSQRLQPLYRVSDTNYLNVSK